MAEIRQLLNIIEQLEKRLGLEAGHSMRLRLEKDSLYDILKKSTTFDAWDRMMSSGKSDQGQATPTGTPVSSLCFLIISTKGIARGGPGVPMTPTLGDFFLFKMNSIQYLGGEKVQI